MMINTIIIDDELNLRKGLKIMLNRVNTDLQIVAEAGTVEEGIEIINLHKPDLVFLDIELSDGYSFEILNQLSEINFQIIFITAYDQYAIKAFKYSAVDYLLKPISPTELTSAINRAEEKIKEKSKQSNWPILKDNLNSLKKIVLRTSKKYHLIQVDQIIRCQADQSYTTFYIEDMSPIMISKPLKEYEELLPPETFLRVHQSHLINRNKVLGYYKEGYLELKNKDTVPVSSRRKDIVLATLFK